MRRDVGSVIVVLLGAALLRLAVSGDYLSYVKPGLRWPLLLGAALVFGIGLVTAISDLHAAPTRTADNGDPTIEVGDFTIPEGAPKVAWLLMLPMITIAMITPPALGSFTAARQSQSVAQPLSQASPLPAGDPVVVTVGDFAGRAVWDAGVTLAGRRVAVDGFATPAPDGGWYLTRLYLSCCAADAVANRIRIVGHDGQPAVRPPGNKQWVRVVGSWVAGGGTGKPDAIPWLAATGLAVILMPADSYE